MAAYQLDAGCVYNGFDHLESRRKCQMSMRNWEWKSCENTEIISLPKYFFLFIWTPWFCSFEFLRMWVTSTHHALCINKINDLIHPGFFTKDSLAVWCQIVCNKWMAKDIQQTLPCNSEVTNQLIWNFWNSHCKLSPELQITACFTYLVEVL